MPTIHIPKIQKGVMLRESHLHMTGGLRGIRGPTGWAIGPILKNNVLQPVGIFADEKVGSFCREAGVLVLGGDEVSVEGAPLQSRIWSPILGQPVLPSAAEDTWEGIAVTAQDSGDEAYSSLAHHLCISLRAAGLRLRDASDEYHKQLIAAQLRGQKPKLRFANIPLFDLHLAFHSLLSEMASARDYMAALVAMQMGAPSKVDALNRLVDWVDKNLSDEEVKEITGLHLLLESYEEKSHDPWLFLLSHYRNLFLHKKPIQTDEHARWLVLKETQTSCGPLLTVQMLISSLDGVGAYDALELFYMLYNKLCRLAASLATAAKFKPSRVQIVVGGVPQEFSRVID